jgi:hypothetical protein
MQFNNRETYLAAVAQWKAQYAEVATAIRTNRTAFKDAQREHAKCGAYDYCGNNYENNRLWLNAHKKMEDLRAVLIDLRQKATALLVERSVGKVEAGLQMKETVTL